MFRVLAVAALVAAFVFLVPVAFAHDWFTGTGCCDGKDCNVLPIDRQSFEPVDGGIHIRLTRQQILEINRESNCLFIDEVFPRSEIRPSPVSSYGVCVKYFRNSKTGSCIRCLFEPGDI